MKKYLYKALKIPSRLFRMMQRKINQYHAYDYTETADGWKKYGTDPVYGNDTTGSIFDPYVYKNKDL